MMPFTRWYRAVGVRKPEFLLNPPLPMLNKLAFPFFSVYHYLGTGIGDLGPSQNEPMILAQPSLSAIEHLDHLSSLEGTPRRVPMALNGLIRKHRQLNKKFVPLRNLPMVAKNQRTLITYNYSLLDGLYRYQRSRLAPKLRMTNKINTIVDKINEVTKEISHQHYIMLDLPEFLPSVAEMRSAMKIWNEETTTRFAYFDTFFIMQLWIWIGRFREESLLSRLDEAAVPMVNIVFRDAGRFTLLNLGKIEEWRKLDKYDVTDENEDTIDLSEGGGRDKLTLQKGFLGMLMRMTQARNEMLPENIEDVDSPSEGEFDASISTVSDERSSEPGSNQEVEAAGDDDEQAETTAEAVERDIGALDMIGTNLPDLEDIEKELDDAVAQIEEDPVPRPLATLRRATPRLVPNNHVVQRRQEAAVEVDDVPIHTQNFLTALDEVAETGGLSVVEYRRFTEQAYKAAEIKMPDGRLMRDYAVVSPKETEIASPARVPDIGSVQDKSMLESTLLDFTNRYVDEVMQRDIAGMSMGLLNAGVLVKDYKVEEINEVTGAYYSYAVDIKPIQGQPSTLRYRIPKVDENGQFTINGTKYYLRMQRGDLPIRKINAGRVALTSYYGKVFVDRCNRKVHNYGRWLTDNIRAMGLDDTNELVYDLIPRNVFVNDAALPRLYTTLSTEFQSFTVIERMTEESLKPGELKFFFNYAERNAHLGLPEGSPVEKDGKVVCGLHSDGSFLLMDHSQLYKAVFHPEEEGYQYQVLPDLPAQLRLDGKNVPVDFAEVMVFGKPIPMGVVLGYYMGLDNLVKALATPRIVPTGKRVNLLPTEWAMYFEDETWVFNRSDRLASMILGGWRDYTAATTNFRAHEFNSKDVYLPLLDSKKLGARYLRELDLLKQMFIDPITNRLLIKLGEPTTWTGLLNRSCELLLTDQAPAETDTSFMRIKGYERFAGALYTELVRGMRQHNAKGNKARFKIDHSPYAVWKEITQDPSKEQVCETNPIQNLKEREAVTYTGTGGRSARTMSKKTRIYHASELGTISESTVDSSDVGINIFTSANPQFNCLEGLSTAYEKGKTGAASLLSTSALVSPASDQDDAKRVLYAAVQHRHTVGCKSYRQNPMRTGYEQVIPHRTSPTYAVTAKKAGTVVSATADGIVVKYDDGKEQGYPLGVSFGKASGLTIPHRLVSPLKTGDTFAVGAPITYNPEFFEPDMINSRQIVWKSGVTVLTALMENPDTLEDSSAISETVGKLLTTTVTNIRSIVVDFTDSVYRMVRDGDSLETNDILCVIEDVISGNPRILDEKTISTLQGLSSQTPGAKYKGTVSRIEVYYHGDKTDMSATLKELADASDRALAKRCKAQGQKVFTGSVSSDYRVGNEPLFLDQAVINVYISTDVKAGIGDKGVFVNQMKTVIGRVFSDKVRTQSGRKVDAIFGAKSIDDRIVDSPIVIGTTVALLEVIAKRAVEAYES